MRNSFTYTVSVLTHIHREWADIWRRCRDVPVGREQVHCGSVPSVQPAGEKAHVYKITGFVLYSRTLCK